MISEALYEKLYEKYSYLSFAPKNAVEVVAAYQLVCEVIKSDDAFIEAVRLHLVESDKYPSHIDLKNALIPKLKEYSMREIFDNKDENHELFFIKNWITKNCILYQQPKMDSFDYTHRTHEQVAEWGKQASIADAVALKTFKQHFKDNPDELKPLLTGEIYKLEIAEKLKLEADQQRVLEEYKNNKPKELDLKNIGRSDVKKIKDTRKGYKRCKDMNPEELARWSQAEVDSRKKLDTYSEKPWLKNPAFDYEGGKV